MVLSLKNNIVQKLKHSIFQYYFLFQMMLLYSPSQIHQHGPGAGLRPPERVHHAARRQAQRQQHPGDKRTQFGNLVQFKKLPFVRLRNFTTTW